ncbi:MAG TPA: NADH-quinone oxidoreductase subunit H [Candidatus Limnocylindria bacterium]|nr:NADH-quinone oxidoreductase subunit H [Candidatus Limnocylindria bacterium]
MSEVVAAVLAVAQLLLLVGLAPAVNGLIKRAKARLQGRRGPPLLQGYFDLAKLLRKDAVVSEHSSVISRATPAVYAGAIASAALIVPALWAPAPLGGWGDAIAVIGLFALARFALALAGLDTGSAFGGMGSSREVALAALAEPALALALFAVVWRTGTTDLGTTALWLVERPYETIAPSQLLALAAFLIAIIAETGRVPVDNPDTHLELTMIHEGMLLEYSGRPLGILVWATQLKQLVLFSLLFALFLPFGIARTPAELPLAALALVAKLAVMCAMMALIESSNAKLRILRVPELLGAASTLAVLALIAEVMVG